MKTKIQILFFLFFLNQTFSQINFEKGYFINNLNQKIECLIKNEDWANSPIQFEYKLDENSAVQIQNINYVSEFSIYNWSKYIRATVNVDKSSTDINHLSTQRTPEFKEETVFLKILAEGKANLYFYKDDISQKYYLKLENGPIEPLIYKLYVDKDYAILENLGYKQKLLNSLNCLIIKNIDIEKTSYESTSLVKIFAKFNSCNNEINNTNYLSKEKRDVFNLNLRVHFNKTSLSSSNSLLTNSNLDYGNNLNLGLGLELEFILPFNKNKWSIIFEPNYSKYSSDLSKPTDSSYYTQGIITNSVNYSTIDLPFGIRHYLFLNKKSKLFINGTYGTSFSINSSYITKLNDTTTNTLDVRPTPNYGIGIGYNFRNKFILELRNYTNQNIISNYIFWSSNYSKFSLILGYTLF
ncbi:porin family protein [Flavobacterium oreochromis]|uniref:Outer membrane protein beta-barrel domain-containing protein n=1 Tax=Flavobacterium columnare TaxID=996 RepID=A0A246G8T3_9FLAO|nr:tRNA modification GTPase [Flavobacterium oreochromis]OWP75484.1 hypothetical protein BWK62_11855 [Flavobacterium oreochromis]